MRVDDDANPRGKETLRHRLTGRTEKGSEPISHILRWGETEYTLAIVKTLCVTIGELQLPTKPTHRSHGPAPR